MMSETHREVEFGDRKFPVDGAGFLVAPDKWDKSFAEGMASGAGCPEGLTEAHWKIIHFIRDQYRKTGRCPLVYQTCRANSIRLQELHRLFPVGYLRSACLLAGITYKEGFIGSGVAPRIKEDKVYRVDVRGFLVDPEEWDEAFVVHRAQEMKLAAGLTDRHWQILKYLRNRFQATGMVPTVYGTCQDNKIDIEELERLFPDGYHRGAVKLAGLRVR